MEIENKKQMKENIVVDESSLINDRIKKTKRCTECKKVLHDNNKSDLCSYHHNKDWGKRKLLSKREADQ